jgi:hypothetical protein
MNETTLINRAAAALERLGLTVHVIKQPKGQKFLADGWLHVGKGRERTDYVVEAKRGITPATLGATVVQLRHVAEVTGQPALFIAPYVTPPMAEKLREQHQQFADAAGNAYLEAPNLMIYITGRKPERRDAATQAGKAFTTNGLKVLFALICDPTLAAAPYRTLAPAAGVALGAIPAVMADLGNAGHIWQVEKQRRLNTTRRLLDEWALAYAQRMRARMLQATYVTPTFGTWREWQLDPAQARWGGEPAAGLLVNYLKPGVLTIYAEKMPPRLMVEQRMTQAGPRDHERTVELRQPFWGKTQQFEGRPGTVAPALVYADLLATGDGRCIETAELIYKEYLARTFPPG